ncbi:hypothetical protein CPU12_01865 [Malaciobacter molluscorum LMG 25693]|uniref:Cytochrome c domain-containing protein n=1 Tax=Malaciobacter molluscorum LMG 25693 TaxID=870501 RepID=A0A2G1DKJ6_9BACT|nr:hypothetical protein [Malaciobacter molluscorum]AXX92593.1 hypothetical protein AMOL_1626 [Malaciobacter molluscorum LMG 25693]PHO19017.1 hypothetical protein CPU12_01865 [Malaciobacter molluscorum LMG 25693]RXJ97324.1 hypothetical protein CRV00_00355 [Malaciobacter molluscorum]
MVKYIILLIICINFLNANIYEKNCISCHKDIPVSIDKYFYRYLLKYSSEEDVKKAMFSYMKNPTKETTVMPEAFILRFKLKEPTRLSDKELKKAIDIYWEKYKVFGKLK